MPTKEIIVRLLDRVPDYKLGYVLAYIQGIAADEDYDDLFCEQILQDSMNDSDNDETYTLEECKKEWGLE